MIKKGIIKEQRHFEALAERIIIRLIGFDEYKKVKEIELPTISAMIQNSLINK